MSASNTQGQMTTPPVTSMSTSGPSSEHAMSPVKTKTYGWSAYGDWLDDQAQKQPEPEMPPMTTTSTEMIEQMQSAPTEGQALACETEFTGEQPILRQALTRLTQMLLNQNQLIWHLGLACSPRVWILKCQWVRED